MEIEKKTHWHSKAARVLDAILACKAVKPVKGSLAGRALLSESKEAPQNSCQLAVALP